MIIDLLEPLPASPQGLRLLMEWPCLVIIMSYLMLVPFQPGQGTLFGDILRRDIDDSHGDWHIY